MKIIYNDGHVAECPAEEELEVLRHSAAHIMAQAVKRIYPDAHFAYGPATEKGFHYDIDLGDVKLSDEDLLNTFGFETAGFDEYVYAICENILLAENIVLIKVKDETAAEKVKQKLSEYVNDQTMMLESYVPEQAVIAKKSVVGVKGNFVYMIMSSKVSELEKIVNDMVGTN